MTSVDDVAAALPLHLYGSGSSLTCLPESGSCDIGYLAAPQTVEDNEALSSCGHVVPDCLLGDVTLKLPLCESPGCSLSVIAVCGGGEQRSLPACSSAYHHEGKVSFMVDKLSAALMVISGSYLMSSSVTLPRTVLIDGGRDIIQGGIFYADSKAIIPNVIFSR